MNMGNSSGSESSDQSVESDEDRTQLEEVHAGARDDEDQAEKSGGPGSKDTVGWDFSRGIGSLFDSDILKLAVSKIKDDIPVYNIQLHSGFVIRWLEDRISRNEHTVTLPEFSDMLAGRFVSREEAVQVFDRFDSDDNGSVDVDAMLQLVKHPPKGYHTGSDLTPGTAALVSSSLTPGFADVFGSTPAGSKMGAKIHTFTLKNRPPAAAIPFPILEGFRETTNMRQNVVRHHIQQALDKDGVFPGFSCAPTGDEMVVVPKAFLTLDVSSNSSDKCRLTDGDLSTYWQSSGLARSHFIRLFMKSGVLVKQLFISVKSSDQSYVPAEVHVLAGRSVTSLRIIKEVRIRSNQTGSVLLVENLKVFYPIIQISLKRCQNDGCDCKIYLVKATGYKLSTEKKLSVSDVTARWYLELITGVATSCMPLLPPLRKMIIDQTRRALLHIPPLSLTKGCTDRPQFLTDAVLDQVETFLHQITEDETGSEADPESEVLLLLSYSLARGRLLGILKALLCIAELSVSELPAKSLVESLRSVTRKYLEHKGRPINLSYRSCDDEKSAEKVLDELSWSSSPVFQTTPGKTNLNLVLSAPDLVQLTKAKVKVEKGKLGASCGLIFVFDESDGDYVEETKKYDTWTEDDYRAAKSSGSLADNPWAPVAFFVTLDDWDEVDVNMDEIKLGKNVLIKFLRPRDGSSDRVGVIGVRFSGFLRPQQYLNQVMPWEKSRKVGSGSEGTVSSDRVMLEVLAFILSILGCCEKSSKESFDVTGVTGDIIWTLYSTYLKHEDQLELQQKMLRVVQSVFDQWAEPNKWVEPLSKNCHHLRQLFDHLCQLVDTQHPSSSIASLLIVQGAKVFFPDEKTRKSHLLKMIDTINSPDEKASTSVVFESLCQFFSDVHPAGLLSLPRPNDPLSQVPSPRECLDVMENIFSVTLLRYRISLTRPPSASSSSNVSPSLSHGGDSIRDVSSKLASVSLNAPEESKERSGKNMCKDDDANDDAEKVKASVGVDGDKNKGDSESVTEKKGHGIGDRLRRKSASSCKSEGTVTAFTSQPKSSTALLLRLISGLQAHIVRWAALVLDEESASSSPSSKLTRSLCKGPASDLREFCSEVLIAYVSMLMRHCESAMCYLMKKDTQSLTTLLKESDASFFSILRELMVLLHTVSDRLSVSELQSILETMTSFYDRMWTLSREVPAYFFTPESAQWEVIHSEPCELRLWEEESLHNYANNQHVTKLFSWPAASHLTVTFDPRCQTERRYDYLEFTDAVGVRHKYDEKVGTEKWPLKVTFKGSSLHFTFHSDPSNNEWGYQFTVSAYSSQEVALHWAYDLMLSQARFIGSTCSSILRAPMVALTTDMFRPCVGPAFVDEAGNGRSSNSPIQSSELWKTVFRAGYRHTPALLERSFSGFHGVLPLERAHYFLSELCEHVGVEGKVEPSPAETFIQRCRAGERKHGANHPMRSPGLGGKEVDGAVMRTFAALVSCVPQLMEDLEKYVAHHFDPALVSDGLVLVFSVAENMRLHLVSARQKMSASSEVGVDTVKAVQEKGDFLLRFACVTQTDVASNRSFSSRPGSAKVRRGGSRRAAASSTGHVETTPLSETPWKYEGLAYEKFPTIRSVLEFLLDPRWTVVQVEALIQERRQMATAIQAAYTIAEHCIRLGSDHTDTYCLIPNALLLSELAGGRRPTHQRHYAQHLDGCGLQLETLVRNGFYKLTNKAVNLLRRYTATIEEGSVNFTTTLNNVRTSVLYLLTQEWRAYDLRFLCNLKLPELLFTLTQDAVMVPVECAQSQPTPERETSEMEEYERNTSWLAECANNFEEWYTAARSGKNSVQMFIAKFCDLLAVEVTCDSCHRSLTGPRFRCLDCFDMDFCAPCFVGGLNVTSDHTPHHRLVHLLHKCDGCRGYISGDSFFCDDCGDYRLCYGCHTRGRGQSARHKTKHTVRRILTQIYKTGVGSGVIVLPKAQNDDNTSHDDAAHVAKDDASSASGESKAFLPSANISLADTPTNSAKSTPSGGDNLHDTLQTFIHCYSWFLFVNLSLIVCDHSMSPSTITAPFSQSLAAEPAVSAEKGVATETETQKTEKLAELQCASRFAPYVANATELLRDVMRFLTESVNDLYVQGTKYGAEADSTDQSRIRRRVFVGRTQEKILGLLGVIVKQMGENSPDAVKETLFSSDFFSILLKLAGREVEPFEELTQFMSLRILSHILEGPLLDLETFDSRAKAVTSFDLDLDNEGLDMPGMPAARMLIDFTVSSLKRKGFVWTRPFVQILQTMCNIPCWRPALSSYFSSCVEKARATPDLHSVISLSVVGGYPEVLSPGVRVSFFEFTVEERTGIILKHYPEKLQSLLIDLDTRKRLVIPDENITSITHTQCTGNEPLLRSVIDIILTSKDQLPAEDVWILSLCVKSFYFAYESLGEAIELPPEFVQKLVHLAGLPSQFDDHWALKDLEVWSTALFSIITRDAPPNAVKTVLTDDSKVSASSISEMSASLYKFATNQGSAATGVCRARRPTGPPQIGPFSAPPQSPDSPSHLSLSSGRTLSVSSRSKEEWETAVSGELSDRSASSQDTMYSLTSNRELPTEACPEPGVDSMKVTSLTVHEQYKQIKQKRLASAELLKKELGKLRDCTNLREKFLMVSQAIAVLYARKALLSILVGWPEGGGGLGDISSALLDQEDSSKLALVLDMLNRSDNPLLFEKVVAKVLRCCDPGSIPHVASLCARFMEEENTGTLVRESPRPGEDALNTGKVCETLEILGASYLLIKFDSKCELLGDDEALVFSTRPDFKHNEGKFCGPPENWKDFQVPGSVLHYKHQGYIGSPPDNDSMDTGWGWKFTVTGGRQGRFHTGYTVLHCLLTDSAHCVRMQFGELWRTLVGVACLHTADHRLKTIQLLLYIVRFRNPYSTFSSQPLSVLSGPMSGRKSAFGTHGDVSPFDALPEELDIDLTLLSPLWSLYQSMVDAAEGPTGCGAGEWTPTIVRALTELFAEVETLALVWGKEDQYIDSTMSKEELLSIVKIGFLNVARVSLGAGLENHSTSFVSQFNKPSKSVTPPKVPNSESLRENRCLRQRPGS